MDLPTVELPALVQQTETIIIGAPVVIIWLLSGIASAMVATNKGRSGCSWFLLGFLLGPLGLVLSFAVSKNQPVLEQRMVQRGEMQYCPYCAELGRSGPKRSNAATVAKVSAEIVRRRSRCICADPACEGLVQGTVHDLPRKGRVPVRLPNSERQNQFVTNPATTTH